MFKNRGIAFKLILLVSASSALIFLLILSYNYQSSKKMIEENARQNAWNLSRATVNRIETALRSVQKVPENLACYLENSSYNKDELVRVLRAVVETNHEIYGAAIAFEPHAFDRNALYFAPYFYKKGGKTELLYLGSESYKYFYLDWYQIPMELRQPQWSEPYFDEGAGNILMATYSVPFYRTINGGRRLMGIVTSDISLEWLRDIVSSIKILKTGYGALLSRNGTFITHPSKELIMNDTVFGIAEARGDKTLREAGKQMVRSGTGSISYKNIWGKQCRMYYAPVPSSGWSLSLIFPVDELMADVVKLHRTMLFGGAAGIVLLSLAVVFIARSITRPLTEISNAATEMGSGNLDIDLPSVRSHDEVGRLSDAFHSMRDSLREYIRKLTETTAAKEKIESELKIASDIQMSILPRIFPAFPDRPEFDIFALIEPAKEVGGDFYDFFEIDATHLCFIIADVSGKGVPAALYMAVTKTLIMSKAKEGITADRILMKVNDELSRDNDVNMFVTIFCGILDTSTGEVCYANGGHNPPLVIRKDGDISFLGEAGGLVIGAFEGMTYTLEKLMLGPGDTVFMYTDGVTEAMNEKEELFSDERLERELASLNVVGIQELVSGIMEKITFFTGDAPQSDDITMLAVRFLGGKTFV
ncbi:MAG: SpoIIE family protein phosphatase [Nitrospirae bacterium]|nr:SpoIIE family protein phosphatase [Nitrospirota bacterium]